MKTIVTLIFLIFSTTVKSQTTDVLYLPSQKSLVASYNNNYNGLGYYIGGRLFTTIPQPLIYTTPLATFNRVGLSFSTKEFSVMGGTYFEFFQDEESEFYPDIWLKIYPVRSFLNKDSRVDISLALNYSYQINYAIGISISLGHIY